MGRKALTEIRGIDEVKQAQKYFGKDKKKKRNLIALKTQCSEKKLHG